MSSSTGVLTNVVLAIITLLSLILNILLLLVLLRQRKQTDWTISHRLILCIATTDITLGLLGLANSGFQTYYGDKVLLELEWFCQATGSVLTMLLATTITLTSIMALNRYLILCKRYYLSQKTLILIISPFLILYYATGIAAASEYNFQPVGTRAYCYPSLNLGITGKLFYFVVLFINIVFPIIFSFCYLMIISNFSKIARREENRSIPLQEATSTNDSNYKNLTNIKTTSLSGRLSRKVGVRAFVYLILYVPCWIPNLVAIGWDLTHMEQPNRPPLIDTLAVVSVLIAILANPVIIFLVHTPMVKELRIILKKLSCLKVN